MAAGNLVLRGAPGANAQSTSLAFSREKVVELAKRLESSQKKLATIAGKGEKHAGEVIEAGEYLAATMALGYVRGRYGAFDVKGIPAEVLIGLACHAVGFSGFLGKHGGDVHNLGNASLGFALALEAISLGEKGREKEKNGPSALDRAREIVKEASAVADEVNGTPAEVVRPAQRAQRKGVVNGLPAPRAPASEVVDSSTRESVPHES